MAEAIKHVLAACNGSGAPIAYLSPAKCWTSSLHEAVYFASRHEADDFLRANAHDENPGPVRSVCISMLEGNSAAMERAARRPAQATLFTGIYG